MSKDGMKERLSRLASIPAMAARDHRLYLDDQGNDKRLASLTRAERRKVAKGGRWLSGEYVKVMRRIQNSGAGYPVDRLLRELAIEYTNRYAASGIYNQPLSFNYFEPFCDVDFIEGSIAPYARPLSEINHLFSVMDFFDYTTGEHSAGFSLSRLLEVPERRTYHFNVGGNLNELTFLTADGREFVVAGFSMVRHGDYVHWYILGGAVFLEDEWLALSKDDEEVEGEVEAVPAWKRLFLEQVRKKRGRHPGPPVPLEGTKTCQRMVVTGEIDLATGKHLGRCFMRETQNAFEIVVDDPTVFDHVREEGERQLWLERLQQQIKEASILWSLGETMLQLPAYFAYNIKLAKDVAVAAGKPARPARKGGEGIGAQFKTVTSIDVVDDPRVAVREFTPPHYKMETGGFWRRLPPDGVGRGPKGEQVTGKTWVERKMDWREENDETRTIYVKSTIAAAKTEVDEYLRRAEAVLRGRDAKEEERGVLYVLRCALMAEEVYKVGWTTGTARERSKELSDATGVPSWFIVVDQWHHADPRKLEKNIHALLDPYRVNDRREFFRLDYPTIKKIIEAEISRLKK